MGIGAFCAVNGGQCKKFVGCPEFGATPEGQIIQPKLGESLAPWVAISFEQTGQKITVGNESCPGFTGTKCGAGPVCGEFSSQRNTAIIKSFQTSIGGGGDTNGSAETKVEILDEEGGNFTAFIDLELAKNREKGEKQIRMDMGVQYGWTYQRCEGSERIKSSTVMAPDMISKKGYFTPTYIDVNTEAGLIKYTITGSVPIDDMIHTEAEEEVYGWDSGNRMRLKQAIKEMFKQHNIEALFLTTDPKSSCGGGPTGHGHADCPTYEWSFRNSDGGCQGPLGVWKTQQRDPVQAAIAWLQEHVTKEKKGFVVGVDYSTKSSPRVIFWESPKPDCAGAQTAAFGGTYVVNGGSCSPVINFKPKFNWLASANVRQGGASGSNSQENVKADDDGGIKCNVTGDGSPDRSIGGPANEDRKGRDAQRETNEAYAANQRAQRPNVAAISAEMTVQGDPRWSDMFYIINRRISIIHINPFHILKGAGKGRCADWLSKPSCNPVTSNRNWRVTGVDHQIKEGSYLTTLRLVNDAPGVDIDRGLPIGGPDGTNFVPKGT